MKIYDLVIIGTGPAGMTSAIYSARAGLNILMIENSAPGGRLINTAEIENFPGTGIIKGFDLANKMMEQVKSFNVEIDFTSIDLINHNNKLFEIELNNNKQIKSKTILIATGTRSKGLENIDGYNKFLNKGISHCIVCDGAFSRNKEVVVIGGGNSATEETLFSSKLFKKITILNSFPDFSVVEKITMNKLEEMNNVKLECNVEIESINGEDNIESVSYRVNDEKRTVNADAVFIYIGNIPNTDFASIDKFNILDGNGFIIVDENMKTNYDGIYAAGDVIKKNIKQISTAISDGTIAAINIKRSLDKK